METLPDPQESVVVAGNEGGGGVDGCSAARDAGDGDKKEVERSEDIRVAADDVLGAASPCDSRIASAQLFPSFLSCLYLLRCALAILAASIALPCVSGAECSLACAVLKAGLQKNRKINRAIPYRALQSEVLYKLVKISRSRSRSRSTVVQYIYF